MIKMNFTNKAIFLDRDDTLIKDKGYMHKIGDLEFLPSTISALKKMQFYGYKLIIITNQSGIGRGYYSEEDMKKFNDEMLRRLKKEEIDIDGVYYCPHHPKHGVLEYKKNCECRKPNSGLFKQAIREHNIEINKSFNIGDKERDIKAGKNVGCKSILVLNGRNKSDMNLDTQPDFIVEDLAESIKIIKGN